MNTIEKELHKRAIPELFLAPDGHVVTTKEEWERVMRPYWKEKLMQEEYGAFPPVVTPEIETQKNAVDFAGKAVWETVTFTFRIGGKEHKIPTQLAYPTWAKESPARFFLHINFRPDFPDRYMPVEEIIDNGFGVFSVCYNDITHDDGDFTDGLAGLFANEPRKENEAGKIVYWSYTASRMMDYLLTRPEADKTAIGVTGHSRLGKTALLTAAFDERFAFACSNNSGCSGAALSRCKHPQSETVKIITDKFPYWFAPKYKTYAERETELPFDQHCLAALVAPRKLFVGAAVEDVWADTDNQFLTCVAASKAWELYGEKGFIAPDRLPQVGDAFHEGNVGFHLRAGKHYYSRTDWLAYFAALKK